MAQTFSRSYMTSIIGSMAQRILKVGDLYVRLLLVTALDVNKQKFPKLCTYPTETQKLVSDKRFAWFEHITG